jgi:hypothetical protein
MAEKSIVFIISLPRSGSTLLQRLLDSHQSVSTLGEVSLLLRFLGDHGEVFRFADYRERNLEIAKSDIRKVWPEFDKVYLEHIRLLMQTVYSKLAGSKSIFVDKTPSYTLIVEKIYECFPKAKFIVLWRHPLAVAASVSKTYCNNTWYFDNFWSDLTNGIDRMNNFDTPNKDRVFSLQYEDLVKSPGEQLEKIGKFLNLKDLSLVLKKPLPKTNHGTLGDQIGTFKYKHVSTESLDGWKQQYKTIYRQNWAKKYFDTDRGKWLNDRGYFLPKSFDNVSLYKNIYESLKEIMQVHKKEKKNRKYLSKLFRRYNISPC